MCVYPVGWELNTIITNFSHPSHTLLSPLYSASEGFVATYPTNVVVSHDGSCLWVPPGMFRSTCAIDITWFPFDDQQCELKFGSWTHTGQYLNLSEDDPMGGDTSDFIRNGEWELIGEETGSGNSLVRQRGVGTHW